MGLSFELGPALSSGAPHRLLGLRTVAVHVETSFEALASRVEISLQRGGDDVFFGMHFRDRLGDGLHVGINLLT